MKLTIYTSITLIILSFLTSCSGFQAEVEIPNTFEFQEQVFISGLFTNEIGFVTIDIQKSIPADSSGFNPINDAQVVLYSRETANSIPVLVADSFTVSNGRYTSAEEISPIVGHTYWVDILLQDGTTFTSEEEILKSSIALTITDNPNSNEETRITIADPIDEENFYLFNVEYFEGNNLISVDWGLIDDINDESELALLISNQNNGVTVKINLYHINFNTFQFYNNSLVQLDDGFDIFFTPLRNLYGNITNTTINKVALGNFGIAGFSSVTIEF